MKASFKKKTFGVCAAAVCAVSVATMPASASSTWARHKYWCRAHNSKSTDMYITLSANYSDKNVSDAWWSDSYSHWPNAYTYGDTASGDGWARGTYTIYSSLITQWASLSFNSKMDTIYIYV